MATDADDRQDESQAQSDLSRTMRIDLTDIARPPEGSVAAPRPRKRPAIRITKPKSATSKIGGSDFDQLLQSVYDGAVITEPDGIIVQTNARFVELMGYEPGELEHLRLTDLLYGAEEPIIPMIRESLVATRFILLQSYFIRKDGSVFPAETAINRLVLNGEEHLCFFVRDITLRKAAEEELLTEHTAIHNAGSAIAIADLESRLTYVNPAAIRMWGAPDAETMLALNLHDLFPDNETGNAIVETVAAGVVWNAETEVRPLDGSLLFVQGSATAVLNAEDQLVGMVLSFSDITARKRAEEKLREAKDELDRRVQERTAELYDAMTRIEAHDRAKSEFVANVSHELKTPLASIRFGTRNLLRGVAGPLSEAVAARVQVLDQECVRMLRTVEDILDVSRVEAGALHLARTRLQLARLVHRSIAILAPQIQARRTNLRVSCPDGAGFVDADPGKMERALVNVLGNAIKFTKPEGLVEVGIGADPAHPQCLVVSVIDNGIGIAPHQIEKVTEKFYRAGEHISGTGLGLYLARQTIELHGGRLEIASPPPGREKGTRVSVVLPAARAPVLLLSGGDPATLAALQAQVGAHDYRVLACTPADDVDAILADRRADLAVVDFSVQPAWGLDLVRRIKSHDAWAEAPILVVTPLSPDFAEQEFLKELALRILPKPWQENDLLNALEAALLRDETPARAD